MYVQKAGPLTATQRKALEGDEPDPYGTDQLGLCWRKKDCFFLLRAADTKLLAAVGMVVVDAQTSQRQFAVVGIGDVFVPKHRRGRGLARLVVSDALRHAKGLGPEFAMLFCGVDLVPMYERLGFSIVAASVTVEQADGAIVMPLPAMWQSLRSGAEWPPGAIRLHSLPF